MASYNWWDYTPNMRISNVQKNPFNPSPMMPQASPIGPLRNPAGIPPASTRNAMNVSPPDMPGPAKSPASATPSWIGALPFILGMAAQAVDPNSPGGRLGAGVQGFAQQQANAKYLQNLRDNKLNEPMPFGVNPQIALAGIGLQQRQEDRADAERWRTTERGDRLEYQEAMAKQHALDQLGIDTRFSTEQERLKQFEANVGERFNASQAASKAYQDAMISDRAAERSAIQSRFDETQSRLESIDAENKSARDRARQDALASEGANLALRREANDIARSDADYRKTRQERIDALNEQYHAEEQSWRESSFKANQDFTREMNNISFEQRADPQSVNLLMQGTASSLGIPLFETKQDLDGNTVRVDKPYVQLQAEIMERGGIEAINSLKQNIDLSTNPNTRSYGQSFMNTIYENELRRPKKPSEDQVDNPELDAINDEIDNSDVISINPAVAPAISPATSSVGMLGPVMSSNRNIQPATTTWLDLMTPNLYKGRPIWGPPPGK